MKNPPRRVPEAPELKEIRPRGSRAGQRGLPRVPRGPQRGKKVDQDAPQTTLRGPIWTPWGPFGGQMEGFWLKRSSDLGSKSRNIGKRESVKTVEKPLVFIGFW